MAKKDMKTLTIGNKMFEMVDGVARESLIEIETNIGNTSSLNTNDKTIVGAINELSESAGGGGTSKAIIDVTELPTENINTEAFYRLLTGTFIVNDEILSQYTCLCVEALPEVGVPVTTDMATATTYYDASRNECYGYVDDTLSLAMSIPVGWYDAGMLLAAFDGVYGGVITNISDAPEDTVCLLLESVIYSYKDNWESHKSIGRVGSAKYAEVFNNPNNEAVGDSAHAEGNNTRASGNYSHAEGALTIAPGICSHAEGNNTLASGNYSHAEGADTIVLRECSHAEGMHTIAAGDFQHVQGKFNSINNANTYAHIVGNGESVEVRSNAHTLSWDGTAWFANEVRVGGTGQFDANAKTLATQDYVNSTISEKAETWTFTLEDGSTVTKKVVLA